MLRSLALALLSVVIVVGLVPSDARAHSGKQSYLYLSIYDDGVEGRVEMPALDLGRALDLEIPQNARAARAAIGELTDPITEYVNDHVVLSDESGRWDIEYSESLTILPTENGPYVVLPFVVGDAFDEAPTSFTADFSVIIEHDPEKDALLIIEDDWATATFDNGSEPLLGFSTGMTEQHVELGGASTIDSMRAIRGRGTDAVRIGIDSMLIVVAVVVPALLLPDTRRSGAVSASRLARRVGTGLLALVAGHTITLWLVGTGVFTASDRMSGIAASVGLCAMAVFGLMSSWRPSLWAVATPVVGVVGLLQGLGLGAYFEAQDLGRRRPVTSLLAFHIGVVVAVVVLVVLVSTPLVLIRRTRFAPLAAAGLGVVLLGYGLAWLGERSTDSEWPIEEVANPLRVWPRNVLFVLIAVAIAAAINRFESRSGRLRAIDEGGAITEAGPPHRDEETVTA